MYLLWLFKYALLIVYKCFHVYRIENTKGYNLRTVIIKYDRMHMDHGFFSWDAYDNRPIGPWTSYCEPMISNSLWDWVKYRHLAKIIVILNHFLLFFIQKE